MGDIQKSAYPLFVIVLHIQHKLSASPLHIPSQRKGAIKRMHITGFKCGQIILLHRFGTANFISYAVNRLDGCSFY
jgi:hypothetical protein